MISLKSPAEMESMRAAGKVVGSLLKAIAAEVRPGRTTRDLDKFAEDFIRKAGAEPAFKGYCGFPATICVSVNEEVVHGIPGKRALKEGDIVGVDVGAKVNGLYADAARTFAVGHTEMVRQKLIDVAREALRAGIAEAVPGKRISDISNAVQKHVEKHGFSVVRNYVGHGIGTQLHEEPQVPNFGGPNKGPLIRAGMALAIEPMVNAGTHEVTLDKDGWTVRTKDGKPSSHFEDTILIREGKTEVLTDA